MASTNQTPELVEGGSVTIRCKATQGAFAHEMGILIRGMNDTYESMIDSDMLNLSAAAGEDQDASLEVAIVKVNGEKLLIELPRQVVTGGRRIWVPKSEIQSYGHSLPSGNR